MSVFKMYANLVVKWVGAVEDSDFYQMLLVLLSLHQIIQWTRQTASLSFRIVWISWGVPFCTPPINTQKSRTIALWSQTVSCVIFVCVCVCDLKS